MRIYGINHTLKACAPFESLLDESNEFKKHMPKHVPKCLPECEVIDFIANIRVNRFGVENVNDVLALSLHYESFAYDIITEYHESLSDFLCKL